MKFEVVPSVIAQVVAVLPEVNRPCSAAASRFRMSRLTMPSWL
jgi:hypothetical protein